jgi:hypothetical protein
MMGREATSGIWPMAWRQIARLASRRHVQARAIACTLKGDVDQHEFLDGSLLPQRPDS